MLRNGSTVSKCAVSRACESVVLMLGTWKEETGKELHSEGKGQGGKMFITGIRSTSFWPPVRGEKPLSCWPGTRIKYPLGQLLILYTEMVEKTLCKSMIKTR